MNKKEITRVHYTIHTHHTTTTKKQENKNLSFHHGDQKEQHILPQTPNSMPMHHHMFFRSTQSLQHPHIGQATRFASTLDSKL